MRGERERCARVTRSYATSDWNRESVSSLGFTEICAVTILSPVGRKSGPVRTSGLRNASAASEKRIVGPPIRCSQDVAAPMFRRL